jgi:hypothetical protein
MLMRNAIRSAALGLVLIGGAACAPIPPANPTASPAATMGATQPAAATPATETVTPTAAATPLATGTPTPAAQATGTETPTPAVVATGGPVETPGPITADTDNIFAVILRGDSAPAGWTVQPCEGDGPFLCISQGQEHVGAAQLTLYPMETRTDFQEILEATGLPRTGLDLAEPEQWAQVTSALEAFVEAYHDAIEADRQVEYGDKVRYERLENERVPGSIPWLKYGFRGVNEDGSTFERWVSYVGYDGDLIYILVAPYRTHSIPTFRSDEELVEFLPHLDTIVAGLRVPLPVLQTGVTSIRALKALDIFRSYSGEAGNPVGEVAAGETVQVTGVSPVGRHWRVNCPDAGQQSCWIAGTADATEPPAR